MITWRNVVVEGEDVDIDTALLVEFFFDVKETEVVLV